MHVCVCVCVCIHVCTMCICTTYVCTVYVCVCVYMFVNMDPVAPTRYTFHERHSKGASTGAGVIHPFSCTEKM